MVLNKADKVTRSLRESPIWFFPDAIETEHLEVFETELTEVIVRS